MDAHVGGRLGSVLGERLRALARGRQVINITHLPAVAAYGVWYARSPLAMKQAPLEVEIPRGAGLRTTVGELQKAGLAVERRQFELLARSFGLPRSIGSPSEPVTSSGPRTRKRICGS